MASFDDSSDPDLGAACNRLAAYTLPIPDGAVIDEASGLTERDLVLILRQLHRYRAHQTIPVLSMDEMNAHYGPHARAAQAMEDADLKAAYQRSGGEPGNPEGDAYLVEINRRNLDL